MARQETDPVTGRTYYAVVRWTPGDVQGFRPGWTDEQAEDWLADNAKYIEDAMVSRGHEAIQELLPPHTDDDVCKACGHDYENCECESVIDEEDQATCPECGFTGHADADNWYGDRSICENCYNIGVPMDAEEVANGAS